MSKYITKFNTENDYLNALDGLDYPNVSLIGQTGEVKYSVQHPPFQGKLKATYSNSTTYVLDCNGSTALAQSEVRGGSSPYSSMTIAEIGDCVTSIDSSAFDSCSSLSSVTIPSGVTSIGGSAFYGCSSLQSVTIPSGVTSIGSSTFGGCTSLSSITIPSGVTSIGEQAFGGCTSLTSVTIPNSVKSIGNYAFGWCSGLTSVSIGSGVTSIGEMAFSLCSGLTSITVNATNPPRIKSDSFDHTNNCPIYVPSGSVNTYKAATNWSTYASRIQAIPSPSTQQWVSVSGGDNIPSGTVYDLRISSATTINEDDSITIENDETFISIGNLCEAECTDYNEETEECMDFECTGHTLGWGMTDIGSGITDPINPLTFGSDGYWYLNAATNWNGFESDGETIYAPFDIQVLMDI